jgi:hypothetical protein
MKYIRNAYKIFIGKPEGNKPFGKSMYRWEDNINLDLKRVEREGVGEFTWLSRETRCRFL